MTSFCRTYCPYCGSELITRQVEGRERQYCGACDRVIWRNPIPTAGLAVVGDRGVLLARRTVEPGEGTWGVPGGHLEYDEGPAEAATRELEEETGLVVAPEDLTFLDTYTAKPFEGKRIVSTGFVAPERVTGGELAPGDEVSAVEWFRPAEFHATSKSLFPPHDHRFEAAWDWYG